MALTYIELPSGPSSAFNPANQVNTYADLPNPLFVANYTIYIVRTSTGIWPFNRKPAGMWQDQNDVWVWLGDAPVLASQISFTPSGSIAADDVQEAIEELDASSVPSSRQVIAGAGLTGGGDLSTDRTFDVGAGTGLTVNANDVAISATGVTAATYGSSSQIPVFNVNAQGQLTTAMNVSPVSNFSTVDRMTSITSTPGDTLVLTSNGTLETLTPSTTDFTVRKTSGSVTNDIGVSTSTVYFNSTNTATDSFSTFLGTPNTVNIDSGDNLNGAYSGLATSASTSASALLYADVGTLTLSSIANSISPLNAAERIYYKNENSGTSRSLWSLDASGNQYLYNGLFGNLAGSATGDLNWQGDTNANLFWVDASADRVGIGTASPSVLFHVNGVSLLAGNSTIQGTIDVTGNALLEADVTVDGITTLNDELLAGAGLTSQATINIDSDSVGLVLGEDQDVLVSYNGTNTIFDNLVGSGTFNFDNTIRPITDTTGDLGTASFRFANLFLSSGARIGSTTSNARLNVGVSGTTTPGIQFTTGSSTREDLWTTVTGGFGWTLYAENSANGDLFMRTNNATDRYRFMRDTSRFQVGANLVTTQGGEALSINGLIHAAGGASFNTGGGSTDPNNFFKVFKSDGTEGALHINPSTSSSGGVGFFTTAVTGGVLNFTSGLASANKAGASILCQASTTDNLVLWFGESGVYGNSAFGMGWIVENSASGDSVIFSKNGSATNSTNIYLERANQRVGIGPGFTLGGTAPSFPLDVNGKIHTDGEIEIDGALNHDGTTVGFFGVTPATRPTTYTITNVTTDRAYDANATTLDEIADVLGTLVADLRTMGLVT